MSNASTTVKKLSVMDVSLFLFKSCVTDVKTATTTTFARNATDKC